MTAADEPILWDRSLFATDTEMAMPCPEVIDLTGVHRLLVFGPLKVLPAGRWRMTAMFGLSKEAAGHDYIVQFIHGLNLAERWVHPTAPGEFEVSLVTEFGQDAAAALRLWNARAMFHGELRFHGARVTREDAGPKRPGRARKA